MPGPCRRPLSPAPDHWCWMLGALALLLAADTALLASGGYHSGFALLNGFGTGLPDALWSQITFLGDARVGVVVLLPLAIRYRGLAWVALLTAFIGMFASHGLKPLFHLPRPPAVLPEGTLHVVGQALHQGSFPSGHSVTIFALAGLGLLYLRSFPLRLLLLAGALLVALSRTFVGVHWPVDVLTGACIGLLSAEAAYHIALRWRPRWGDGAGIALLLALTLTLFGYDGHFSANRHSGTLIALLVLAWGLAEAVRCLRADHPGTMGDRRPPGEGE